MTTTKNNEHKKLNVPNLRFKEFQGEWEELGLSELLDFKNGLNPKPDKFGKGIKFISVMDILNNAVITYDCIKASVDVTEKELSDFSVEKGDILFQRSSETLEDIGRANVYMDDKTAIFGGFVIRGKKKGEYDPQYFNYLLRSPFARKRIIPMGAGAQHFNIGQEGLSKVKLHFANIEEQKKIGNFLSLLDERIATQNKIIDKLQSLIKGIAHKLFQTARTTKPLLEFAPNITSGTDKSGSGTIIPLYGSTGIIGTVKNASQNGNIVLVARVGTIGAVQYVNEPCGVSDNVLIVEAGEMTKYIYHFLKTYNFARITSGTTQPLITASSLKKVAIPTYDIESQTRIVLCLNSLEKKLDIAKQYLSEIAVMKQYLLRQMFI